MRVPANSNSGRSGLRECNCALVMSAMNFCMILIVNVRSLDRVLQQDRELIERQVVVPDCEAGPGHNSKKSTPFVLCAAPLLTVLENHRLYRIFTRTSIYKGKYAIL